MKRFDVFNGDADGICALQQLRLEDPCEAELITGVKRDNALLRRVAGARPGDRVTALDIALAKNREALQRLLDGGVRVTYFDHHYAGEIPDHPLFEAHIDLSPELCTCALVDAHLGGRQRPWAVVGAYGDGLPGLAGRLADAFGLAAQERLLLRELGEGLNYNAYGETPADLIYPPERLYRALSAYRDPLRFIAAEPHAARLTAARTADMEMALALVPEAACAGWALYRLPQAPWSRRVMGAFANHLAAQRAAQVQAVLVPTTAGDWALSLRVPAASAVSADAFCRPFGGGGRRTAAGIDALAPAALPSLMAALATTYAVPSDDDKPFSSSSATSS